MPLRDRLLAALVAVLWGVNFVAIHFSLEHFPPFFLVALRFLVLAIPTVLFVKWPGVKVRWLLGYGLGFGILQFAFLYAGMSAGMPPGLASLVLQASAPFTVVLAALWLRERLSVVQGVGILIAVAGLGVIAAERAGVSALLPVVLTLFGALGWAFGNICSRQAKPVSPLGLTMWMSVVPPVPLLVLSLLVEGPARIGESLATAFTLEALPAMLGLAYTVLLGTVVGSGIWVTLMKRNPSSRVAPFSMLVPVAGFTSAWLILGEVPNAGDLVGGAIVIAGVLIATVPWRGRRSRPGFDADARPTTTGEPTAPAAPPAPSRPSAVGIRHD
ncbi:EamA family transporter [Herbiconiux flava]|uniref:O-acetylserine/cysteine efflux transporter n=1 Tax=Herbiconiux flava TaxID=881268 RepID=A0A852SLT8_9MICO|nr:EamA family transporter [Herbiconiux flava]NYD69409.1 O-acetylserine/cysteine efflux transporter [Herbiconiux flava]GLK16154.1 membrane protein [Herbiconiux flava]